jgi:hypothetical protein
MPQDAIIAVAAIIAVFLIFGGTLAYVTYSSHDRK